jgi:glucose-1-phosphate cytidylyltransferase
MKVAILPGALASSLGEDTNFKPKTMVEIGGKPILWHILMHDAHYGHEVLVIGLAHRGESIKKYYMLDYCSLNRDLSVSLKTGKVRMNGGAVPDWMLELVDRNQDGDGWPDQETGAVSRKRDLYVRLG